MKKSYMAPQATIISLATEGVFAASLPYGGTTESGTTEKVNDETKVLSNKGSWNSGLWSSMEE